MKLALPTDAEDDNASGHRDFGLGFVGGILLIEFDCLLGAMALLAISGKGGYAPLCKDFLAFVGARHKDRASCRVWRSGLSWQTASLRG